MEQELKDCKKIESVSLELNFVKLVYNFVPEGSGTKDFGGGSILWRLRNQEAFSSRFFTH